MVCAFQTNLSCLDASRLFESETELLSRITDFWLKLLLNLQIPQMRLGIPEDVSSVNMCRRVQFFGQYQIWRRTGNIGQLLPSDHYSLTLLAVTAVQWAR